MYQDILFTVPETGLDCEPPKLASQVRPITVEDIPAMVALERDVVGIERERDLRYFHDNALGIWHGSIIEDPESAKEEVAGFLHSVRHPASNMVGPGVARTSNQALALIYTELAQHRGGAAVVLAPTSATDVVQTLYDWGGRNCELHFSQVRGASQPITDGIVFPTFMPETG